MAKESGSNANPRHWIMHMTWHDLLFMHWPLPPNVLRPLIPASLELDLFDGAAWIGVVPFHMTDVRPRAFPRFTAARFPEINVRTYVRCGGKSGVWFFSLDAADRLAVWGARRFFYLPYWFATISSARKDDIVHYRSRRSRKAAAEFVCRYRPIGPPATAQPGSLDYWLTERYRLFSVDSRGNVFRGDIEHSPWPLQQAEANIELCSMTEPLGFSLPSEPPLLHFAQRLDVIAWPLISAKP